MRPPICVKETVPEVLAGLRQFKAKNGQGLGNEPGFAADAAAQNCAT